MKKAENKVSVFLRVKDKKKLKEHCEVTGRTESGVVSEIVALVNEKRLVYRNGASFFQD
ncbi:MAG: hypothetical protein ACFB0B_15325 [Thermonemataceae bacterium]